jgi:hypothetical protein
VQEVGGRHEVVSVAELGKAMKHQHASTKPPRANLEVRPIRREGVEPRRPRAVLGGADLELVAVPSEDAEQEGRDVNDEINAMMVQQR